MRFFKEKSQIETDACCTPKAARKVPCPYCAIPAKSVPPQTPEHLLKEEAKSALASLEGFHYCRTAACDVVYFREDTILTQKDLKVVVGLKEGASPATVCYCFDWTKEKIAAQLREHRKTNASEDIREKMERIGCACDIKNPGGACCLGDIADTIKALKEELGIS